MNQLNNFSASKKAILAAAFVFGTLFVFGFVIAQNNSNESGFDDVSVNSAQALGATLSGNNEVPPTNSTAVGTAKITFTDGILEVNGSFEGLSSDLATVGNSSAHIHQGASGENGPVILPLDVSSDDLRNGTFYLREELTFDQMERLRNGAYINIHTENFPNGEIRGQIIQLDSVNNTTSDKDKSNQTNTSKDINLTGTNFNFALSTASYGHGWALGTDNGHSYLIELAWLQEISNSTNDIDRDSNLSMTNQTISGFGTRGLLMIERDNIGVLRYELIANNTAASPDTLMFNVHEFGEESNLGTLALMKIPHTDFSFWSGVLRLDEGGVAGVYHVEVGTKSRNVTNVSEVRELINLVNGFSVDKVINSTQDLFSRASLGESGMSDQDNNFDEAANDAEGMIKETNFTSDNITEDNQINSSVNVTVNYS